MMWVIIILVLLMILVLKINKKYHLTWYGCQNIRDNMVEKRIKKIRAGVSPPLFGQCPKEIFFMGGAPLPWKWIRLCPDLISFQGLSYYKHSEKYQLSVPTRLLLQNTTNLNKHRKIILNISHFYADLVISRNEWLSLFPYKIGSAAVNLICS